MPSSDGHVETGVAVFGATGAGFGTAFLAGARRLCAAESADSAINTIVRRHERRARLIVPV
jgi:hypothetical protein